MAERSTLERAIALALEAHEGQRDWNGRPFILHPMRVGMALLEKYGDLDLASAGVLHDAVEDSSGRVTVERVEAEVTGYTAFLVSKLTHDPKVPYEDYIEGISGNRDVVRVKLADLTDNLSPFRLIVGNDKQLNAFTRHGLAFHRLKLEALKQGWI